MKDVTREDAAAFALAASAYLASLEHVEAKLPNGVGKFTLESIPSHKHAADRLVKLLERFTTEYDIRGMFYRRYLFLLLPYGDRLLHFVLPDSVIGEVSDENDFEDEEE